MTYAEAMKDWTDIDGAMYDLGLALGFYPGREWLEVKSVFWTNNPLCNTLHTMVQQLVELGALEKRDEDDDHDEMYRWALYTDEHGNVLG